MGNTNQGAEGVLRPGRIDVTVENIGGIDACDVSLTPGVTVFEGRNATNRTSFLRALGGVLGGDTATLKRDAEEGRVVVTTPDVETERVYRRTEGRVSVHGDTVTNDAVLVENFACLLEDNPVRRAVERGGEDLRDVVMEPVDTDAIQDQIRAVRRERDQVEAEAEEIERQRERLPSLREEECSLERELSDVTGELETLEESLPDADARSDDGVLSDLKAARTELASLRDRVDRERESLDAIREERGDVQDRLDSHTVDDDRLTDLEDRIESLRMRRRRVAETVDQLTAVLEFNERLLANYQDGRLHDTDGDAVTDARDLASDTVECWTCGSPVDRADMETKIGDVREWLADRREERVELQTELETLSERRSEIQDRQDRRDQLASRLSELDREIERRTRRLERIQDRLDDQRDVVSDLEDALANASDDDFVEGYRRLSELEYERGRLEREHTSISEEIADLEAAAAERDHLLERRDELAAELSRLRSRIDELENETVESFNEHVADLIDVLDYRNISRVWLERLTTADDATAFELHIVRTGENGNVYEDEVGTLSESERKLVGLVLALAGYRVHDVHEHVPVMLLDSLEAIDGARIATLVDYFADYAPYLLVALLPEDAARLPADYQYVDARDLGSVDTA